MAKHKAQAVPQGDQLFTRADYDALRAARRRLNDLVQKLDKAEACGADCQALRQIVAETDRQAANIELHFMTPPPA